MSRTVTALVAWTLVAAAPAYAEVRTVAFADVMTAAARSPGTRVTAPEVASANALVEAAAAWASPSVHAETNRLTAKLAVTASLPLPLFGTVAAARRVASTQAGVVRAEAASRDRAILRDAAIAWISLARAEGESAAAAIAAKQAGELETIAQGRLSSGAGAEVDVSTASAARARAELAVRTTQHLQQARAAELAGVLGWPAEAPLATTGELPGRGNPGLATLQRQLATHPAHISAERRILVSTASAAEARRLRLPSLALEGGIAVGDPGTPGTDLMVGLTVELPVFARLGARARAAELAAVADRARLATTDVQLGSSLVAAYRRWEAADETVASLETVIVPAQSRAATLSAQAYREGARDLVSALQAERDLQAVRAELVAARADLATAWVDVQDASGAGLGEAHHAP